MILTPLDAQIVKIPVGDGTNEPAQNDGIRPSSPPLLICGAIPFTFGRFLTKTTQQDDGGGLLVCRMAIPRVAPPRGIGTVFPPN
jgi:hypothetical protein